MADSSIQKIAADISVISIALLGVSFILIALAWKGFNESFILLPRDERRQVMKAYSFPLIPVLILVGIFTAVGVNTSSIEELQSSILLIMFGLAVISILYMLFLGIQKFIYFLVRKRKESKVVKVDSVTGGYFISMLILAVSIYCSIFALFGVINTALDINIRPNQLSDFLVTKWLLADAVMFFGLGIFSTTYAYLNDKTRKWKKGES